MIKQHFFESSEMDRMGFSVAEITLAGIYGLENTRRVHRTMSWSEKRICSRWRDVKAMVFPVVMYGCESWTIKKAEHQRTDAFELWRWRRFESPMDSKEIQSVHPKGNQSWIFIGRTDAGAETPILWPPHVKSWLIGKDPDAGKDWRQEEKGTTEDEMVGWHHQLDGHDFG